MAFALLLLGFESAHGQALEPNLYFRFLLPLRIARVVLLSFLAFWVSGQDGH